MKTVEIYVAMHKPYPIAKDTVYRPLQVGAACNAHFAENRDDEGENISCKNPSFCELTGIYWMWKHSQAEYIGMVQYRRYFGGERRTKDVWQRVMTGNEIQQLLESADVFLPKKRHYVIETNYSQYAHAHYEQDLLEMRAVIGERCPSYLPSFDKVMRRRSGHRFNMFVMKRAILDAYASWIFPLLFELEKRIDTTNYDAYNQRAVGFIAERMLDVWMEREKIVCKELSVVNIEPINWPRKIKNFAKRKVVGTLCPRKSGLRKRSNL